MSRIVGIFSHRHRPSLPILSPLGNAGFRQAVFPDYVMLGLNLSKTLPLFLPPSPALTRRRSYLFHDVMLGLIRAFPFFPFHFLIAF